MPEDPEESYIIRAITQRVPPPTGGVLVGPGDDAAVLDDGTVITADAMVEGVHWDERLSPADVGWKLAAVNASDVASCGARPTWAVLTMSLPLPIDRPWVDAFAEGLAEGCRRFGLGIIGGDTTGSTGPRALSLTAAGKLAGPALLRTGGQPGHDLWVSGVLGDADAALRGDERLLHALRRPDPPVALGPALAAAGLASAAMDLSDGLARDLPRLCAASGLSASVDPARLPASDALRASDDRLLHQAGGGEDYQLLFAAAPEDRAAVEALGATLGLRLTRVGAFDAAAPRGIPEAVLIGRAWPTPWSHFEAPPLILNSDR